MLASKSLVAPPLERGASCLPAQLTVSISRTSLEHELDAPRYELVRELGEGAAGTVYLAKDRELGEHVALKKLFRLDQRSVLRFKREFRALTDLHHPNLVKFYDLQRARDAWFLTMEFVDGQDLRRELAHNAELLATRDHTRVSRVSLPGPPRDGSTGSLPTYDARQVARVVRIFEQLASGVNAVHQAGMLHRDLKPSNVLVAKSGRVVVLDFGLVRELGTQRNDVTIEGTVAGTPAYMPPEQALGGVLTAASDWYAFGVMLYEVLSGHLPIDGRNTTQLLQRKLTQDPAPLSAALGPPKLLDLCLRLLQRSADARPNAEQILDVLSTLNGDLSGRERDTQVEEATLRRENPLGALRPLFGRDAELAQLQAAYACARNEQSVVAHVLGTSGTGKSSLIERFLSEVQRSEVAPWVLRSRCHEREAMPFKALDGVADALVGYLFRLDDIAIARLLPAEIASLTQLFPVFERLRVVQRLVASKPRGDAAHVRRRAELGLRELCTNVARAHGLVIWIDDLQWGDLDSASVIQEWLVRPAEAPILIVLSYRAEDVGTAVCLDAVLSARTEGSAVPRFELRLQPLGDHDVKELCQLRLGKHGMPPQAVVERIVQESRGNPFLALQLTALAGAKLQRGESVDLEALSVEELVLRTSALLPESARGLLKVLAVAGRALQPQLALDAADLRVDGRAHVHELQSLRLVRTRHVAGARLLEVYHDRVREAVHSALSAEESTQIHARLLQAVETSGRSDPGWLHDLARGAGQRMAALRYGALAAEIASSSLAFERAAELYERCVALTDNDADRANYYIKAGLVLARCRRGVQAAEANLKASELVSDADRVPLLQLAASHLLRSGRFEQGEALVKRVLSALNIEVPSSDTGYLAALAWEHTRLAILSRTVNPRPDRVVPPDILRRGEFYGTLAIETQFYSPYRAALFQARALRMSFEIGESSTVARALCLTAVLSCLSGTTAAAARAEAQLARAQALAVQTQDPNLPVELLSARAVCAMLLGRLADAIEPSYAAEEIYATRSAGGPYGDYLYMFAVQTVRIGCLQNLGRFDTAHAELRELLVNAHATDNRTAILQVTLVTTTREQIEDLCVSTRARLDRERNELPQGGVGILHVLHTVAVMRSACFTHDFDWAFGVIDAFWPGYQRSLTARSAYLANLLNVAVARLKLNRYVVSGSKGDPGDIIRAELKWAKNKAPAPYRKPTSSRMRARIAYLSGDRQGAVVLLRESEQQHTEIGALDDAARERWAMGRVLNNVLGGRLQATALDMLRQLGIKDPLGDLRGYYPELLLEA